MNVFGPAIGILELSSIAHGYTIVDQIVKKAPVKILEATYMTPGKFFILFNGDEASVDASFQHASELARSKILDSVMIPNIHSDVLPGLYGMLKNDAVYSLGVIETLTMSSSILGADLTAKNADVSLIEIRSSRGIGGKSVYFFTGKLEEVEAGIAAAETTLARRGTLVHAELITNPHQDLLSYFNISGGYDTLAQGET
ncbi:MAG: BMC domain-containing protein [Bdellovibrionales bacterium]